MQGWPRPRARLAEASHCARLAGPVAHTGRPSLASRSGHTPQNLIFIFLLQIVCKILVDDGPGAEISPLLLEEECQKAIDWRN